MLKLGFNSVIERTFEVFILGSFKLLKFVTTYHTAYSICANTSSCRRVIFELFPILFYN